MKLVLVVAESNDAERLATILVKAQFPVTKLGSTGGFLRRKNSTLISGIPDDRVDEVLELISASTHVRTEWMPGRQLPFLGEAMLPDEAMEVRRGGAVVWVLPVERFERY